MKKHKSEINERFVEYFRENFFADKPEELEKFLESLTKPLPKTIRVNTTRISVEDFKARAMRNNWTLTPTNNPTVFRIDRTEIKIPLGHTLEHLLGYFYIQELSASMSVHYLAERTSENLDFRVQNSVSSFTVPPRTAHSGTHFSHESLRWDVQDNTLPYLILDMAASPGGKTTQLAEHFPTSIIVANEPTRDRMAQLVSNTERLGNDRIMITNYDGGFYSNLPETFDRILLDAPCSGEGIGFKESQTVKYWNLKNIHTIARLQTKLLDAAFRALKTGGEILYSTCTLNKIENEGVVNEILNRYPESFEVLFEKRFWPQDEGSGGFFVCKIRKNTTIEKMEDKKPRAIKTNEEVIPLTKDHERLLSKFTETVGLDVSNHSLFEFKRDILAIQKNSAAKALLQTVFPIRLGQKLGRIEEGVFTPDNRIGRDFELKKTPIYEIRSEQELDDYLRGKEIGENLGEWYFVLRYDGLNLGIESANPKNNRFTNTFPREWQRK
ncbi:MAG: hypothetical protein ACD_78C00065G0012 [uncultured bacterium (gcode 4)]|uniref:SAM-dependent MTase RsmB/NOP-type domain-containing protein n=1 Tax=uncultured bacterium (gcode 4) TaxID=1234023 RepID=K1XZ26_9BACT|nr:MAG: hypothetical protein ACD_78C00065G0012 [uncultured bacterium (gcode 4)]